MNAQNKLLQPYDVGSSAVEVEQNITLRLKRSKEHHERELAKVNAALDALEQQPEVAKLLEAVMKAL
jgi:hypothetical protein